MHNMHCVQGYVRYEEMYCKGKLSECMLYGVCCQCICKTRVSKLWQQKAQLGDGPVQLCLSLGMNMSNLTFGVCQSLCDPSQLPWIPGCRVIHNKHQVSNCKAFSHCAPLWPCLHQWNMFSYPSSVTLYISQISVESDISLMPFPPQLINTIY